MKFVKIPDTDLQVSDICMGTGPLGGSINSSDSFALLDAFIEKGGNFIDTAHVYSDWIPGEKSRSEKLIGAWMKSRQNRSQIVIGTKGAHPFLQSMSTARLSPAEIQTDLDESLAYLQTDCIDLYWLHRDDTARPVEEILDTLNAQVKAGKIRYFGASNWNASRLAEAQAYARKTGAQPFSANQVFWNAAVVNAAAIPDPTMQVMDRSLLDYHHATGLAALAYTSQANGLFSKLEKGTYPLLGEGTRKFYPEASNRARLERIQQIGRETGLTTNQVVLGYLLSQPFATIPIIGPQRIDQLLESLSASGVSLSPTQLAFLKPS